LTISLIQAHSKLSLSLCAFFRYPDRENPLPQNRPPEDEEWIRYKKICVRICVRKTFQNLLKLAKIGQNKKKQKFVISGTSFNLRRLGSSEVLSLNQ